MEKILITGANGLIGRHIRPLMRPFFRFRATDISPVQDEADAPVADLTRLDEVLPLMDGVDGVMHLAIASARDFGDRVDAFHEAQIDVNIKGTYNVLEAARRAGVRRVVCASSVMVDWGYPPDQYVTTRDPARLGTLYAATKYFVEVLGGMFAREHELPVICWRIGQPTDPARQRDKASFAPRDTGACW